MAKVIKPGVEGIMISLTMMIIDINQFQIRNALGIWINDTFVGVTNETIDRYWCLELIGLGFKLVPLLYIWCLLPTN